MKTIVQVRPTFFGLDVDHGQNGSVVIHVVHPNWPLWFTKEKAEECLKDGTIIIEKAAKPKKKRWL